MCLRDCRMVALVRMRASPLNPNHFLLTENGQVYVQKKPTMYPPWNSTFDAHINNGRVMHIVVKDKSAEMVSETTVELKVLAERCKKSNGKTEIWVSTVISSCSVWWGAAVGWGECLASICQTVNNRAKEMATIRAIVFWACLHLIWKKNFRA